MIHGMNDEHASAREERLHVFFLELCDDAPVRRSIPFDPSDQCHRHRYCVSGNLLLSFCRFCFAITSRIAISSCIRNHVRTIEIWLLNVRRIFYFKK